MMHSSLHHNQSCHSCIPIIIGRGYSGSAPPYQRLRKSGSIHPTPTLLCSTVN
ncbi:hypothetical protein IQ07DRAFT_590956 [Pyrenochaeta sp. DS3sAY3a]|nr:hypothetical protein IQ07DRAFT_590956 [Pyrenochaeta sp. DS3sAY3a]